jgi:hypothetical protein
MLSELAPQYGVQDWRCQSCTFNNVAKLPSCDMCGGVRCLPHILGKLKAEWQWQDSNGKWLPYPPLVSFCLEQKLSGGISNLCVDINNELSLLLNLTTKQQENRKTRIKHPIRRIQRTRDLTQASGLMSSGSCSSSKRKAAGSKSHDSIRAAKVCKHKQQTNGKAPMVIIQPDLCWICQDDNKEQQKDLPMFRPCQCKCDLEWAHGECFNAWLRAKATETNSTTGVACPLCKITYRPFEPPPADGRGLNDDASFAALASILPHGNEDQLRFCLDSARGDLNIAVNHFFGCSQDSTTARPVGTVTAIDLTSTAGGSDSVWHWQDDDGSWVPYDASQKIEASQLATATNSTRH